MGARAGRVQDRRPGAALTGSPAATGGDARVVRRARLRAVAVGAVVLVADQLTKWWALEALADGPVHVGWTLDLRLTFNTGTAFSLGSDLGPVIALVAAGVVVALLRSRLAATSPATSVCAGLVLGGAVGNLADRAFRSGDEGLLGGAVVDFVDLGWWPVFNLADAAIVAGAVGLVLFGWREPAGEEGR